MQRKFILAVDIESTSPMHISDVTKGTYDPSANRVHRYASGPGIGCSLTRTLELAPHASSALDGDGDGDGDGLEAGARANGRPKSLTVPILTATKLRSALRRACADMIFESWIGREQQVDVNVVNAMTSGAHTTSPNADVRTPQVDRYCENDPFWGLWGGGSMFLEGCAQVSNGLPLIEQTLHMLQSPALAEPAYGVRGLSDMTQALPILRTDSVAAASVPQLADLVGFDALTQAHQARTVQRSESAAAKKASKETGEAIGKKTDLRAINAIEVARAGLKYALRVSLRAPSPAHLGMTVLAMQDVLRNGQIGAGAARSLGQFIGLQSRLYQVDPATGKMDALSEIFGDRVSGYAIHAHPELTAAVAAAQDYLADVDAAAHRAIVYADTGAIGTLFAAAGQA